MDAFTTVSGVAAPLPQANIDTDVIMPKQFLKGITRDDLARGLFYDLRFDASGRERAEFVLNLAAYRRPSFLIVGPNFGCGSSREHAVWGLRQFGIRAVIGTSFASIFEDNCLRNGVLPIVLPPGPIESLQNICSDPRLNTLCVDLTKQTIFPQGSAPIGFSINALRRGDLLSGRDAVSSTLQFAAEIRSFEQAHWISHPSAQATGGRHVNSSSVAYGTASTDIPKDAKPFYRRLYLQVLCAIAAGALVGYCRPDVAQQMKPLGDLFIKLIKMMIEPIIFTTVVVGVAKMGSMKEVGRVGLKALIYFEVVSGAALLLGLIVANVYKPGAGIHIDSASLDRSAIAGYTSSVRHLSFTDFMMHIVPDSVVGAFAQGETLQVVFFSLLFGLALSALGERVRPLIEILDQASQAFFKIIGLIMFLAPIGAFGAMAFTIGKYGLGTLQQLGMLLAGVYASCLLFVFGVLGVIARCTGFSLWRFLRYIREEILIVLGTSTSESALPGLMSKLEALGCEKSVVGLVVPTGYSFNLDGTSIYLSMATLFIAQAAHVDLSWQQQLGILGLLLLTSKGSAAVTGGGFITLAATLSSIDTVPVAGLAILLGIDRFMSEARAMTNLIGNGIATIVVATSEGSLDRDRMNRMLSDFE